MRSISRQQNNAECDEHGLPGNDTARLRRGSAFVGASQSTATIEVTRIAASVEDCDHNDGFRFLEKMDGVWESAKQRPSNIPTDAPKARGVFCDVIQEVVNFRFQFQTKPGLLLFIPANSFVQFQRCKWPEADRGAHS